MTFVEDPFGPWAILLCLGAAMLTAFAVSRLASPVDERGRFASIDGLRGYLAMGVFVHHASIWYDFERSGMWRVPPSRLYTHLGESSVVVFFMITAFLFVRKIVAQPMRRLDWRALYLHRFFRLTPLYLLVTLAAFAIVAVLSDGQRVVPWKRLIVDMVAWLAFRVGGVRDVNGQSMDLVTASVAWSLQYEWAFYFALPLLAVAIRRRVRPGWIVAAVAALALFSVKLPHEGAIFYAFAGGAVGAYAIQWAPLRRVATSTLGTALTLAALIFAVISFDSAYAPAPITLLTVAFVLIAAGNELNGFLVHPTALFLGERSYGIYLLHPLLLFVGFRFILKSQAANLSPLGHWLAITVVTVVLVLITECAARWVEKPGIALGKAVGQWLRWTDATTSNGRFGGHTDPTEGKTLSLHT